MPQRPRLAWSKRSGPPAALSSPAVNIDPPLTKCSRPWSNAPNTVRISIGARQKAHKSMKELLLGPLKSWTRTTAFVGKDVTEVVRRPGALFSLIFGPFLIMGLFGLGYNGQYRPLNTVLVVPANSSLPRDPGYYQQYLGESVTLSAVSDDAAAAREQLQRQQIDLLVI